jgi:hypothetical protein
MICLLKRLFHFLPLSLLASCGSSFPDSSTTLQHAAIRLRESTEPSILFVGNSFSREVPHEFSTIAELNGKRIRVGGATQNGWTLARHAQHEATLHTIRTGSWDVVILQEFSSLPSTSALIRRARMTPALSALVHEVRNSGAIPMLMQTWGYQAGDPEHPDDDFVAMTARLRQGTQAEAARLRIPVIHVGDAWAQHRMEGRAGELFQEDGRHPTLTGNRTTALACYQALFPNSPVDGSTAGSLSHAKHIPGTH